MPRKYKRYGVPPARVERRLGTIATPDVVIIASMMTYWYPGVFDAVSMMRRLFPRARIIVGGVYATLCREHAERHSGADAIVVGPHWPDIVNRILTMAGGWSSVPMVCCEGDQRTWIEPAYDLMRGDTCYPLLTSTGCPCHCTYCATHALWPQSLQHDHAPILNSLERLVHEYGATDIAFYDDALLVKKEIHFLPLMEEITRRNYGLRFHTPNALHIRQLDRRTAMLLKHAGFETIRLGLEVTRKEWQKETGGKVYLQEYIEAMGFLREAGFGGKEIGTYLLYGLPNQSLDTVWEACQIVAELGSEVKLALYSPIPGTPLYRQKVDDFWFDHRADPLLHNCSLAPWRSRSNPYEEYQKLGQKVVNLNQHVRKTHQNGVLSVKN